MLKEKLYARMDEEMTEKYNSMKEMFEKSYNQEEYDAVFIGDSITEGYDVDKHFNSKILNRGIGGDITYGVLYRIEQDVLNINTKRMFLLIGTNDLSICEPHDNTIENIKKMIDCVQEKRQDIEINVLSIYPTNNSNAPHIDKSAVEHRQNKDILALNERIKALSQEKNVNYIDVHSHLLDNKGNIKAEYTAEGLHLTENGYEAVTKVLKKHID